MKQNSAKPEGMPIGDQSIPTPPGKKLYKPE